jgi:hypothetical protein
MHAFNRSHSDRFARDFKPSLGGVCICCCPGPRGTAGTVPRRTICLGGVSGVPYKTATPSRKKESRTTWSNWDSSRAVQLISQRTDGWRSDRRSLYGDALATSAFRASDRSRHPRGSRAELTITDSTIDFCAFTGALVKWFKLIAAAVRAGFAHVLLQSRFRLLRRRRCSLFLSPNIFFPIISRLSPLGPPGGGQGVNGTKLEDATRSMEAS